MNVLLEPAPPPMAEPSALARFLGRAGGRRAAWRRRVGRRLLAAALVGVGVLALTQVVLARVSPPLVEVVVSARAVAAGSTLRDEDLRVASRVATQVPRTAYRSIDDAVGHRVTGPIDDGEVLTSARVIRSHAVAPAGQVAVELMAAGGSAGLVEAGSRVDAYLPGHAEPLVRDALVLSVHTPAGGLGVGETRVQQVVVLAVPATSVGGISAGQEAMAGPAGVLLAVH